MSNQEPACNDCRDKGYVFTESPKVTGEPDRLMTKACTCAAADRYCVTCGCRGWMADGRSSTEIMPLYCPCEWGQEAERESRPAERQWRPGLWR